MDGCWSKDGCRWVVLYIFGLGCARLVQASLQMTPVAGRAYRQSPSPSHSYAHPHRAGDAAAGETFRCVICIGFWPSPPRRLSGPYRPPAADGLSRLAGPTSCHLASFPLSPALLSGSPSPGPPPAHQHARHFHSFVMSNDHSNFRCVWSSSSMNLETAS